MPAGKKFKFQGSQIAILIGFISESPPLAISAITKANPAVATIPSHGRETGDILRLVDVVGMEELDDEAVAVRVIDASNVELIGVDSTEYGVFVSGEAQVGQFSNFCELTNYNRQGGSSPELPATSLCSVAQEFEVGLPDFGTTQLDFNFAPRTPIQEAPIAYNLSVDKTAVKVV